MLSVDAVGNSDEMSGGLSMTPSRSRQLYKATIAASSDSREVVSSSRTDARLKDNGGAREVK